MVAPIECILVVQTLGSDTIVMVTVEGVAGPFLRLRGLDQFARDLQARESDLSAALFAFLFPQVDNSVLAPPHDRNWPYIGSRAALDAALQQARATCRPIRLRLQVNETTEPISLGVLLDHELLQKLPHGANSHTQVNWSALLPWEMLLHAWWQYSSDSGLQQTWEEWLAATGMLARTLPAHLEQSNCRSVQSAGPRLQILLAWADPCAPQLGGGLTRTLGEAQIRQIVDTLTPALESDFGFDVTVLPNMTLEALTAALNAQPYDIVHLLTHGDLDAAPAVGYARLLFDDGQNNALPVTGPELAARLTAGRLPQLVFLHACQSAATKLHACEGIAQQLLIHGIPHVVAMQATIPVAGAAQFARTFYNALADRIPIDQAVGRARAALAAPGIAGAGGETPANPLLQHFPAAACLPVWAVPLLYMAPHATGDLCQAPLPSAIRWSDGNVMLLIQTPAARFYIDKYPVTAAQFARFRPIWTNPWHMLALAGRVPATNVTPADAQDYAAHYNKQLPTVDQWHAAALADQPPGIPYPWGEEFDAARCNCRSQRWVLQGSYRPAPVNSYPPQNDHSLLCDAVGNVNELVHSGEGWIECGGSCQDIQDRLPLTRPPLSYAQPNPWLGFRCVATVPQAVYQLGTDRVQPIDKDQVDYGPE